VLTPFNSFLLKQYNKCFASRMLAFAFFEQTQFRFQLCPWKKSLNLSTMPINSLKGASFGGALFRLELSSFSKDLHEFKYRDRVSIIGDILKTVKNSSKKGKRKTQIMQSANLNFDQVNKYLALLITNGYIKVERLEIRRGFVYRMTSKGLDFVKVLEGENLRLQ